MSEIWEGLKKLENYFIDKFASTGLEYKEIEFDYDGWTSRTWAGKKYRRAHIAVADLRDTKGIYMMHCCIFPHTMNNGPIFGYDVVAGKNKITGFFHDFSSTGNMNHQLIQWFKEQSGSYEWNKNRALPEWGKAIFSPYMIAAGNISNEIELEQIISLGITNLYTYLDVIEESDESCLDNTKEQNFYCSQQKLNPHNPRVMLNLGLKDDAVTIFIEQCLFPEIR
jgi:phycocyanobilin:ferredoxin oxidoreductase